MIRNRRSLDAGTGAGIVTFMTQERSFASIEKFTPGVIVVAQSLAQCELAGGNAYEDRWTLPLRVHHV
jgi:tRNA1(Val) A37 N6-methylase TrmN6